MQRLSTINTNNKGIYLYFFLFLEDFKFQDAERNIKKIWKYAYLWISKQTENIKERK